MKVSLSQLSQFVAVVDERSFTGAAATLHVAQPWLSTRVRHLEEQVGFRLLYRSLRGVNPTAAGAEFYDGAKALLNEGRKLEALVARIAEGSSQTLHVGAIPESFYIPERNRLLEAFHAVNPGIALNLDNRPDPELRRLLLNGELDAAFLTGTPPARLSHLRVRKSAAELLMPRDHPLSGYEAIPLAALDGVRVGVFPRTRNPAAWDETAGRLEAAGAELETWPETLRDALVAQTRRSGTIVLVLSSFGDRDEKLADMIVRPIADASVAADFFIARRAPGPGDRSLDCFWRFAEAFLRATEPTLFAEEDR